MGNTLIKNNVNGGIMLSSYKEYADDIKDNIAYRKEDTIIIIDENDYNNLSADERKDKTFLITNGNSSDNDSGFLESLRFPIETTVTNSTNRTPTSKAAYEALNIDSTRIKHKKEVSSLPSTNNAKEDTLYYVKDNNSGSYKQYYIDNGKWILVGIENTVDVNKFVTRSSMPFYFGINNKGEYGYYNRYGGFQRFRKEGTSDVVKNAVYLGSSGSSLASFNLSDLSKYGVTELDTSKLVVEYKENRSMLTLRGNVFSQNNKGRVLYYYEPDEPMIRDNGSSIVNTINPNKRFPSHGGNSNIYALVNTDDNYTPYGDPYTFSQGTKSLDYNYYYIID